MTQIAGKIISLACTYAFIILILMTVSCSPKDSDKVSVVLYCSADQAIAEPVIEQFQRVSGIQVLARYDTEASKTIGLVQKIRGESNKPVCDVFWSSEVFHTIALANEGLLDSYKSIDPQDYPKAYRDDKGQWFGFGLRSRVIAYNSSIIDPSNAPKSLEDLLKPEYKGRIAMARPVAGTTTGDIASWFVHYGDIEAQKILQGLKDNDVLIVDGNSTAVRMIATSQADICMTDTDDVYAGQRNNWPIKMNLLDQGGDGCLAIPNTVALIKGSPNPQPAKVLMEFLLSKELERILVESDSHNSPLNEELQKEYPEYAIDISKTLKVDYNEVAKKLPVAIKAAMETLD